MIYRGGEKGHLMSLLVPQVDLVSNWPSNVKWELVRTEFGGGSIWLRKTRKNRGKMTEMEIDEESMKCPIFSTRENKSQLEKYDTLPQFTDEEYSKYLQSDLWTLEETRKLWNLCSDYNMRFPIIANRMESKTIHEIKQRFFYILNKLHQIKGLENINFIYDKEYDLNRNKIIEQLSNHSPEFIQEQHFVKQFIGNYSKDLDKRWNLRAKIIMHFAGATQALTYNSTMPDLLGHVTGSTASNIDSNSIGNAMGDGSGAFNHNKNDSTIASSSSTQSARREGERKGGSGGASSSLSNKQKSRKNTSSNPSISSTIPPSSSSTSSHHHYQQHNGPGRKPKPVTYEVKLRSQMMKPIKVGLCRHIDRMMLELNVPLRPKCPTERVIAKYDILRAKLIELDALEKVTIPHGLKASTSTNSITLSQSGSISTSNTSGINTRQNSNSQSMTTLNNNNNAIEGDDVIAATFIATDSTIASHSNQHYPPPSNTAVNIEKKKRKR